jgi:hypothetical protein
MLAHTRVLADRRPAWSAIELDPAIPGFFQLVSKWTERFGCPFRILHDASKPLAVSQEDLERSMDPSVPPALVGFDRRRFAYPLSATGIMFGSSREHPQIQLADLIAGAMAYVAARRDEEGGFHSELLRTRALDTHVAWVWPTTAVTPEDLDTVRTDGVDAVDAVTDWLSRNPRKYRTGGEGK